MNTTKKFTIFWNPIKHSKSPGMYNRLFKKLDIDADYSMTNLLDWDIIKEEFLSWDFLWANITVPHKEIAFKQADEVRWIARKIWAVNTYIRDNWKVIAYNTDAPWFFRAIEEFIWINSVLIIWAWGTSKAIATILIENNINVTILNRSENRLGFFNDIWCETYTWDTFENKNYDLIVNATSAGLNDDNYPAPIDILKNIIQNTKYCFDCIYWKATPFLDLSRKMNKITKDWEDMLLYQAVIAFEIFTWKKLNLELIDLMRRELKKYK